MATYYSSHNAGGGGVGSIVDPFTLQELADAVDGTAPDLGLVMNTGVYTPAATIDFDVNASALLTPNIIRGANADGSDDGTVATISGSGLGGGDDLLDIGIVMYTWLENLRITAATQYNIFCDQAALLKLENCQIDSSTSHGFYMTSTAGRIIFVKCEINGSTGGCGLAVNSAARGRFKLIRCSVHDNSSHGIHDGASVGTYYARPELIDTLIYDNGGDGANYELGGAGYIGPIVRGSVFFGNTGDGLAFHASRGAIEIDNSIFRSNGGFAINTNTGSINAFYNIKNNCYHNNTGGVIDINGGTSPGTGHVLADPEFVSEVDGSEDFGLQATSPCLVAGIDAGIW